MSTFAAVMTSKGSGAISTIQLFGDSADKVIKKIFKTTYKKELILNSGRIYIGTVFDGNENLDEVTIGCDGLNNFSINCHGNPLIVSDIMKLLSGNKVQLVSAEQLLAKILKSQNQLNTIAVEAKIFGAKSLTIEGIKIINNQAEKGLAKTASIWLQPKDNIRLNEIKTEAEKILVDTQTAKLIITGCKVVIIGPPNSGKSTLLNCLAGKEKAIVTDVKGTTRDWISARCRIGPLSVELIDTAGLSETLIETEPSVIDKASQLKSLKMLEEADFVLLVLDINQVVDNLEGKLLKKITGKKVITVLNKSDLPAKLKKDKLPPILKDIISISAKNGTGLEQLLEKILEITDTNDFDLSTCVCFTGRQESLLQKLCNVKSKQQALSIITELLNGNVSV
ncbi:MAG: GTPase [Planctomycetota bacterium]|jgi:tRNA modification GTPase